MTSHRSREIRLVRRPEGMPRLADFACVEVAVPAPGPGQVLVRNIYMSVDPYMRGRMIDRPSYVPPFQIGETLSGRAVGQVVEAGPGAKFQPGDYVRNDSGWREWFLSDGTELEKIDPDLAPLSAFLGSFGVPGLTAYVGLLRIAGLKKDERVFVSAAAGAVGSIACQIAKNKGCTVVGSAGSDEKCDWLRREGRVDEAINYKSCGDLTAAVARALPDGIDVDFENVGGAHLEAALANMRAGGRIALCGLIEEYNATGVPDGPRNFMQVILRSLTLKGFVVTQHLDMTDDFMRDIAAWTKDGKMTWRETILDGIEKAPEAFIGLFAGANFGKMLVRLGPDRVV